MKKPTEFDRFRVGKFRVGSNFLLLLGTFGSARVCLNYTGQSELEKNPVNEQQCRENNGKKTPEFDRFKCEFWRVTGLNIHRKK